MFAAYGVAQIRRGWTEKFAEHLETEGKLGYSGAAYLLLGKVGHIAKGIALAEYAETLLAEDEAAGDVGHELVGRPRVVVIVIVAEREVPEFHRVSFPRLDALNRLLFRTS